ncbi:ROK family protein [Erwinia sp. E_sp_B04_7]|uniref:sugar metabolism global transcriptional regulator Mlc n=1 Tax=unclassified Erwinia TaxID=2622719 RepID=UPI0030CE3009
MIADGQPGHIDQIKQTNAGAVYRLIDRFGPISRIELSKKALLAPASITKIVREMLEAHLVQETEFQEAGSRGRPAVGLILDTQAWHYLSVRIGNGEITLALRDLSSQLVVEDLCPLPVEASDPLLTRIVAVIDAFFIRHQQRLERLTAIAITLPGILNARTGIVHRMPFYQVTDMPLGPELEKRSGLPVYIQHDVCAWTLAESLFGASQEAKNVIQVVIDHQVGAGVISGGRLLHNGSSTLVEIGHIQVDPQGKQCYCGNHGCLETVASSENLLELANQRLLTATHTLLSEAPLTLDSLCDAAIKGDPLARELIAGVGQSVGRIVAIMVNLFNPQKILIGSPLNQASEILFPAISDCIQRQSLPDYSQQIEVEPTQFYNVGTMPGAALVKDALYNGTLLVKLLQG